MTRRSSASVGLAVLLAALFVLLVLSRHGAVNDPGLTGVSRPFTDR